MKCRPTKKTDTGEIDCKPEEATHIWLAMPGPYCHRRLPVVHGNTTRKDTPCWSWNGAIDKPTLHPSILTKGGEHICHCFVNDGMVKFLNDCTP